ncbi:MAG: CopG family transcriptional regulator [Mobilicoccus sp.]|nr:CopG family transcriptional regulator [Mobilicoccus sp.]
MKTAVSINDATFRRAEAVAAKHGLNRSQFYSLAVARYADELESADVTAAIDAALDSAPTDDAATFAAATGRRALAAGDEEW